MKGVSQRLRENSDEESEGLSLSRAGLPSCWFGFRPCNRPCWYLSLARPNRSCRLRETCAKRIQGQSHITNNIIWKHSDAVASI